jgi:hypothetical protein
MANFYHLYISPREGITREVFEPVLSEATDWFRYDNKNWILYTNLSAIDWYSKLKQFVEPGGTLFICKLDVQDHFGMMSPNLWEWIRKSRSQ